MIDLSSIIIPLIITIAIALVILISLFIILSVMARKGHLMRVLDMTLFSVALPKEAKKEGEASKPEKELIGIMEQFYASLIGVVEKSGWRRFVYGPPHIACEIAVHHIGEDIHFYVSVPRVYESVMERHIQSYYPTANVEKVKDYNIFNPDGEAAASILTLESDYIIPVKTYESLDSDPLVAMTNAFSKIEKEGEGLALQIVFRPAQKNWIQKSRHIITEMQRGKSFQEAAKGESMAKIFKEAVSPVSPEEKAKKPEEQKAVDSEMIKFIESKILKTGFEANIRLVSSAATKERAASILASLEAAFGQFSAPKNNSFKIKRVSNSQLKRAILDFSFRNFNEANKIILNAEELSSLYHLPIATMETPKVKWLKAKSAPAPLNMPLEGLILGKNVYRGQETVARLTRSDRRRHLYIIGQTGTGKSVFQQELIRQDILNGEGVCVIDPHGDLVNTVLSFVPDSRAEDVILFDPSDVERPMGLNMIEYDTRYPEQKTMVVGEMLNIFDQLYDLKSTGGPMFETYMRNALMLIMDDPESGSTLLEVPRVLADAEFRAYKLSRCLNPVVKNFWEKEAEKAGGEAALANIIPYITSKLNQFLTNDIMLNIVAQQKSGFNFREVMDNKKILLVNLQKGRLGDINSSLLGLIIVGKLLVAALSRTDIPEDKRNDFYLYIDEFQNFTTKGISVILSEARKYRLALTVGHQFIAQLKDEIRDAVFGNVGTMISFRVGAEDAEFLTKQFSPEFSASDIINLDNFNAIIKTLVNNTTTKPFNIQTYPPSKGDLEIAAAIKEISRLKYGISRDIVQEEIRRRLEMI